MFQPNIKEQKHSLMERREQYRAQIRKDQIRDRLKTIRQGMLQQSLKTSIASLQQQLQTFIQMGKYQEVVELLQSSLHEIKSCSGQISQHSLLSYLSSVIHENHQQKEGYFSDDEEPPKNRRCFIKDSELRDTICVMILQTLAQPKISYRNYPGLHTFLKNIWCMLKDEDKRVFIYLAKIFQNCLLDAQSSFNQLKSLGLQQVICSRLAELEKNRKIHQALFDLLRAYYTHQTKEEITDVIINTQAQYFLKMATAYVDDIDMQERALGLMGRLTDSYSYLNEHVSQQTIQIALNLILSSNLRVSQYALQLIDNLIYWTDKSASQTCIQLGVLDRLELLIERQEKMAVADQNQKARISKVSCIICNLMCSKDRGLRKKVKYHTVIDAAFRGIYPNSRLLGLGRVFCYLFHQSDPQKIFHIVDNLLMVIAKLDLKDHLNYVFHDVIKALWQEAQEFWPEADKLMVTLEKYGLEWVLQH